MTRFMAWVILIFFLTVLGTVWNILLAVYQLNEGETIQGGFSIFIALMCHHAAHLNMVTLRKLMEDSNK